MDAELVRARLEADGLQAWVWSSGLGPWRLESAVTEMTGVPSDFNAHQVAVERDDVERALEILGENDDAALQSSGQSVEDPAPARTSLSWMRERWVLTAAALFLLFVVLYLGVAQ
jgi:hypothetical protein